MVGRQHQQHVNRKVGGLSPFTEKICHMRLLYWEGSWSTFYSPVFFMFYCAIDWFWHWPQETLFFVLRRGLLTAETLHHHHAYNVNIMSTWSCIILKEIFTVEPGNGESTHHFNGEPFIQPQWGYKVFIFFVFAFQNEIYPILITSRQQNVVNSSCKLLKEFCLWRTFAKWSSQHP